MFLDRRDAGLKLAKALSRYAGREDVIVLGLPRGGVPVAFSVASELSVELDVFIVRKLGVPGQEELAMGAVASGGVQVVNREVIDSLRIPTEVIAVAAAEEFGEVARREILYRGNRSYPNLQGRTAILVDDGLATGSTMRAAAIAVRKLDPASLVIAVPVAAKDTCRTMEKEADVVVCLETPEPFDAVGIWYENFTQTTDDEVRTLLAKRPS